MVTVTCALCFSWRLYPVEGTHAGVHEWQPVGRTHTEEVCGGPNAVVREGLLSLRRKKQQKNIWWTDHNPHSPSPEADDGEEVENWQ